LNELVNLRHPFKRWLGLGLLALLYTSLNAIKPLHIDDSTFYQNAAHIANRPADPYGFAMMKFNEVVPANEALAPPVLPYWWSHLAIRVRAFPRPVSL
jgi:hypothetical protein